MIMKRILSQDIQLTALNRSLHKDYHTCIYTTLTVNVPTLVNVREICYTCRIKFTQNRANMRNMHVNVSYDTLEYNLTKLKLSM